MKQDLQSNLNTLWTILDSSQNEELSSEELVLLLTSAHCFERVP